MIEITNFKTYGLESAVRGMRMPMFSHHLSDSGWKEIGHELIVKDIKNSGNYIFQLGEKDLALMKKLYKAGSPHAKFMRQIGCSFTLKAPVYLLSEFDTYKVGVVRNSSSFMHKGLSKPFTKDDFSISHADSMSEIPDVIVSELNRLRDIYLETKNSDVFLAIREILPMSYLYTSEITTNYAVLANMIMWRKDHRLHDWRQFCDIVLNDAIYLKDIMGFENSCE